MWQYLAFGALGQLVRSAVGIRKAALRGEKTSFPHWFSSIILGGVIGLLSGVIFQPYIGEFGLGIVSFLAGYAGTDYIEGLTEKKVI